MNISNLFDMSKTIASTLFEDYEQPYMALDGIAGYIRKLGKTLDPDRFTEISEQVWIANSATVTESAVICPPCIIDEYAEIRHCAFIRGSAIIGKRCVVGNSTEIKNSILFDEVQIPHFNYVGDSILGYSAHMGAGAVTSNVKSDKSSVATDVDGVRIQTDRRKLGAMIGDLVEIGCGSVLCPGAVIGRGCMIYPLSTVRGTVSENSIFKSADNITQKL